MSEKWREYDRAESKRSLKAFKNISFVLLTIFFLWWVYVTVSAYVFTKGAEGMAESVKQAVKTNRKNRERKLTERLYKNLLGKGQLTVFSKIAVENKLTYINKLKIEAKDSSSIIYRFEQMKNGQTEISLEGVVFLDTTSILDSQWRIPNWSEKAKPAYRFVGEHEGCQVEILVVKDAYFYRSTSAFKYAGTEKMSVQMYQE